MPRYAAFLRGVSPTNAKMPEVKRAFESAGFTDVKTLLSSGNVVFTSSKGSVAKVQDEVEAALAAHLTRSFLTFVRPVTWLQDFLASEPYKGFAVPAEGKRIVTFLRGPPNAKLKFPIQQDGASIFGIRDGAVFSAYVASEQGPAFMALIEKTFGKSQTTRTWQTLERVVASG